VNTLPEGWFDDPTEIHAKHLEYFRELPGVNPQLHPLAGVPVVVVAYREGNDDILLRLLKSVTITSFGLKGEASVQELTSGDFCVVHLSWSHRQEIVDHPTLEFAGSFEAFLAWEENWGQA
jgi:hypothetical protein